jgi:hypothetical protein
LATCASAFLAVSVDSLVRDSELSMLLSTLPDEILECARLDMATRGGANTRPSEGCLGAELLDCVGGRVDLVCATCAAAWTMLGHRLVWTTSRHEKWSQSRRSELEHFELHSQRWSASQEDCWRREVIGLQLMPTTSSALARSSIDCRILPPEHAQGGSSVATQVERERSARHLACQDHVGPSTARLIHLATTASWRNHAKTHRRCTLCSSALAEQWR